jgi:hypothetical protein
MFQQPQLPPLNCQLVGTEFAKGLDLANLIHFEPLSLSYFCIIPISRGRFGGSLALLFSVDSFAHQNNKTCDQVDYKLQQKSSNNLTLVSTTCVSTTIQPLSSTLRTKIDDVNCVGTEPLTIRQIQ